MVKTTTCGLCGQRFAEDDGQPACRACPLRGACHFLRCPGCGYENPVTPGWLARLRDWAVLDLSEEQAATVQGRR